MKALLAVVVCCVFVGETSAYQEEWYHAAMKGCGNEAVEVSFTLEAWEIDFDYYGGNHEWFEISPAASTTNYYTGYTPVAQAHGTPIGYTEFDIYGNPNLALRVFPNGNKTAAFAVDGPQAGNSLFDAAWMKGTAPPAGF